MWWESVSFPSGQIEFDRDVQQEPGSKDLALRESTNWYLYSEQKESH